MAGDYIEHRKLWKADIKSLERFAKWAKIKLPCYRECCRYDLILALARYEAGVLPRVHKSGEF